MEDNLAQVADGELIIPAETVEKFMEEEKKPKVKKIPKEDPDVVALFSEGNMFQEKWGELSKGYNIVKKEYADKWLQFKQVRIATPEEVAKYYGVK